MKVRLGDPISCLRGHQDPDSRFITFTRSGGGAKECGIPGLPAIFNDPPLPAGFLGDSHETVQSFRVIKEVRLVLLREPERLLFRHPARPSGSRFLDRRLHSSDVLLRPVALHRHGVTRLKSGVVAVERHMIVVPLSRR